jgi:Raf kinase inhibitor-like YbhB/YbcL family protein
MQADHGRGRFRVRPGASLRTPLLAPVLALGLALGFGGCGDGGDPEPAAGPMTLVTKSFPDGGAIPVIHGAPARGGQGLSPQLSVDALPRGAASIAIVMDDETPPCGSGDGACIHWGVFGIPADRTVFAEGEDFGAIPGVVLGAAYNDQTGYQGPNPLLSTHRYTITVFALGLGAPPVPARPTPKFTRAGFEAAYGTHILGKASLTGTFRP